MFHLLAGEDCFYLSCSCPDGTYAEDYDDRIVRCGTLKCDTDNPEQQRPSFRRYWPRKHYRKFLVGVTGEVAPTIREARHFRPTFFLLANILGFEQLIGRPQL